MKRIKSIITVAILISLSLFSGKALAQIEPGTFSVTPSVGYYGFEDKQNIDDGPVYGIGLGYDYSKRIGVEAVFNYVNTDKEFTDDTVEAYIAHVDGLYHFMPDNELVPYIAAGLGTISTKESGSTDTNGMFNAGAGIKYFLSKAFAFRADARYIFDFERDNNNYAVTAGFAYFFGKAEPAPAPVAAPAPMDSDGDGVNDEMDQCPNTPRGATVDSNGCPKDSDGDGVYDGIDQCPNTPKGATVDSVGCPKDSDGDGVYDGIDQCPNTPRGATVDSVGCPKDSDGDGVYDGIDECPGTPLGLKVDAKGCHRLEKPESIDLRVEFDFDKAVVKTGYFKHINDVADFMNKYPEVNAVIEGHTDSIGAEEYNMNLSQRRALSVMQKLIDKGVSPSRLKAVGYGESKPIADNKTREGRDRNRRVMATISTIVITIQ